MNSYNPNNCKEIPWFEQESVDDFSFVPEKFLKPAIALREKGYCVLETEAKNSLIDEVNEGIFNHLKKDNPKLNPEYYHYNDSPRIIEAWKHIPSITTLSNNKNVMDFLEIMYQKKPLPFSTINFLKSSE